MRKPKTARPETWSESQSFTARNNRYRALGLCPRCTAQAAYGHQHGFTAVHPPCPECAPLVATFPHRTSVEAWRKVLPVREGAA